VRYIHENPVKARLVEKARDYAWSSDRHYRLGGGPEWLDPGDVLAMLGGPSSSGGQSEKAGSVFRYGVLRGGETSSWSEARRATKP